MGRFVIQGPAQLHPVRDSHYSQNTTMKATSIFSEIVMHFLSEQFGINARERRPSFFITPAHNKACLKDAGSLQSLSASVL